jgi:hypothetical protein
VILYTFPCHELHAGLPFRPVIAFSCEGVTRWKEGTPERFALGERIKAAQSIGLWPGESRTFLLREDLVVEVGARPEELLMRCWLLAGKPRLGRGPVVGTRRPEAVLGGKGRIVGGDGRDGGGMRDAAVGVDLAAGFGGGAMFDDALCALFGAGKVGAVGGSRAAAWSSSPFVDDRAKAGISIFGSEGSAFGVLSPSS